MLGTLNATQQAEAYQQLLANLTEQHQNLCGMVAAQTALLSQMLDSMTRQAAQPNIERVLTLTTFPIPLARQGRRHTLLWLPGSATQVVHIDMGAGDTTITLNAGWNVIDTTETARIWLATGGPLNVVYRATDYETAGLI